MAKITNKKAIFFVTSPRSPYKLLNEIKLLVENFEGNKWNKKTQIEFYQALSKQEYFKGSLAGEIDFKARDRINRAPKALGLVDLQPEIKLTEAGHKFIYGNRRWEVFLRQLLKFQLQSPFHIDDNALFNVKPYLELIRLIYELDGLSKHEIALFVMQLTNYKKYPKIKSKIVNFRTQKKLLREKQISYKSYVSQEFTIMLHDLYSKEINSGKIALRENRDKTLKKFIQTKRKNHLDYADASIRYLHATGLFSINPRTSKIYVVKEYKEDIEQILSTNKRHIIDYELSKYKSFLFNPGIPYLASDNKNLLINKIILKDSSYVSTKLTEMSIDDLKDIYDDLIKEKIKSIISNTREKLRNYEDYEDIIQVFENINSGEMADPSLFFEWNIWRVFSMLNDGIIQGNFKIDDDGNPLYTAPPNMADITCRYKEFDAIVEVTRSSGQKQYEMEGEPVARHYGQFKKKSDKNVYGIFVAPKLNDATIAHYFLLHRTNIEYYGGQAKIIPLNLDDLITLLFNAYNAKIKPTSSDLKELFEKLANYTAKAKSEKDWYQKINKSVKAAFIN